MNNQMKNELRIELNRLWEIHSNIDWMINHEDWINQIKSMESKFPEIGKLNRKRIKILIPSLPKYFSPEIIIDLIEGKEDIIKIDKMIRISDIYNNLKISLRMDEYRSMISRYNNDKYFLSKKYPELSNDIDNHIMKDYDSFIKDMI